MALPSSGAISFSQINTELGVSATATRSLNDATTRTLFGIGSGSISLSQGYGKANAFSFTISANQTNANLRTLAVNAGWNQSSALNATIASDVVITAASTGTYGLTINGSFPGGLSLVNNGVIRGYGGAGARGGYAYQGPPQGKGYALILVEAVAGSAGGPALLVQSAVTITNNGVIGGGGGGGGATGRNQRDKSAAYHGQSGSGGLPFGAAGPANAAYSNYYATPAGNAGTTSSPGAAVGSNSMAGFGGAGGGYGSAGGSGVRSTITIGGGTPAFTGGGVGGTAVSGNSNITWAVTGTRSGAIV